MKQIIHTSAAPQAVGPYSQAVKNGNFIFTAGQIPLDPATGQLVDGGIQEHARQVLKNLQAVLQAAGTDFSHVVKATVFLADIDDFKAFNGVYAEFFPENPPARSAFQVAALPLGAKVEIEMIAMV